MARRKRSPSAAQRDKEKIAAAKYLKAQGLLSKRTKLHGGKFISRGVLNRVNSMEWIAKNNYKALKVSRQIREEAIARGVQVEHGRLIVPKGIRAEQRIKAGAIPGLIPVPGGQMLTVHLPYRNMMEFARALRSGEVDKLKLPQEAFNFTVFGHFSRYSNGFKSGKELADYLERYEPFTNPKTNEGLDASRNEVGVFGLYRMIPGDYTSLSFEQRLTERNRRKLYVQEQSNQRAEGRRTKRISEISGFKAEQRREQDRERKKRAYAAMKENNPEKLEAIKRAGAARSIASRNRRKGK